MKVDQFRVEVIEVDVGWMPIKLHFDDTNYTTLSIIRL